MKSEILKYYNELANSYDKSRFSNSYGKYIDRQEKFILDKYINKDQTDHHLDLACGTGRFLEYANYGIDLSPEMVKIAKHKYPNKEISIGSAESIPHEDLFFDNTICFHLFMHLDFKKTKLILDEVSRVTKPKGYFIFDIPSEKRRNLTGYKSKNWHGGMQMNVKTLEAISNENWKLISYHGIAFFPIHRIPKQFRKVFLKFDNYICNSILKEYCSHLIFILQKK